MRLAFDIETDDLLDKLTTIHSLVLCDLDTGELLSCAKGGGYATIEQGLDKLAKADALYAHNGIKFDYPALAKLFPGWQARGKLCDSLVMARLRFAHQKELDYASLRSRKRAPIPKQLIGKHSLEAWGHRLGEPKVEYKAGFAQWTPEMQVYCEQDVHTLVKLVHFLTPLMRGWERALDCELELAWYLAQQERNGWPFDVEKAQALQAKLAAAREVAGEKLRQHFGSWQAPNGKPFLPKRDNAKRGYVKGVPVQRYKTVTFNPGSRDQIGNRLKVLYGWEPKVFTDSGKPKVDENTMRGLTYPPIPDLMEYLLLDKRLGQLAEGNQACLRLATADAPEGGKLTGLVHIHGSVNQGGTVTHRCSHAYPNIAQTPKVGKPWGEEFRELYYVPTGWQQLGADESGLELRCLAHYLARYDDGAYARTVVEGNNADKTDVHSVNQRALGLPDEPADGRTTKGRDATKTYFYAYLYGAGDLKLGKILYPGKPEKVQKRLGSQSRQTFLNALPALGSLVDALGIKVRTKGYVTLPDGRRAYIRHQHAALNTLLQGAGAVISKWWVNENARRLTAAFGPQGWRGQWVALGFIHDEVQIAVRPEIAEEACRIAVAAAEHITQAFDWRCPLTGEAKLGGNWRDTH